MKMPTVRLFISSTFRDFREERDHLQKLVFPRLSDVCLRFGAKFQPVDLRWGISPEAVRDHRTVDLCLDELDRCRNEWPRPSLLVLIGDRYGWRPIPGGISRDEFEAIAAACPDADLLRRWYQLDENAIPAEYRLVPVREETDWSLVESELRSQFQSAIVSLGWDSADPRREKYETSATHREIIRGALEPAHATPLESGHALCLFRRLDGFPDSARPGDSACDFADFTPDGSRDVDAMKRISQIKSDLRELLPQDCLFDYQARWNGTSATADLTALCERLTAELTRRIESELARHTTVAEETEHDAHERFGEGERAHFVGQAEALDFLNRYTSDSRAATPLAILGPSGAGKTALAAKATESLREHGTCVVVRFLGVTPDSTRLHSLLTELCDRISVESSSRSHETTPDDLPGLVAEFRARLDAWSNDRPLALLIDGVDQLDRADGAHTLHWIPKRLPEGVRLVYLFSSDADSPALTQATHAICGQNVLHLKGLTTSDPGVLLDGWLAASKRPRKLAFAQRQAVLAKFRDHPRPFYLKLLAEEARNWRSSDPIPEIPSNSPSIIAALFDRLELGANHGPALVRAALSCLCASRRGLVESEIVDLLSLDPQVMSEFVRRSPTELAKHDSDRERRLPLIVWTRLADDLRPYLTRRQTPGGPVLDFFHGGIRQVATERTLQSEAKAEVSSRLADYFGAQPDFLAPEVPNRRKADEWPRLLANSGRASELATTLAGERGHSFVEAKTRSGLVRDLIDELRFAAATVDERGRRLLLIAEALRRHAVDLETQPESWFSVLWNECWWFDSPELARRVQEPPGGFPSESTTSDRLLFELLEHWRKRLDEAGRERGWLRALRPPRIGLGQIKSTVLRGHTEAPFDLVIDMDGRFLLSRAEDGTTRLWDVMSVREVSRISGGGEMAFTRMGPRLARRAERGNIEVCDVVSGGILFATPSTDDAIDQVALSPDGRCLAVAGGELAGYAYHIPGESGIRFVEGNRNEILEMALVDDGARVAKVLKRGWVRVWDVEKGRTHLNLGLSRQAVEGLCFHPDGNRLAFALSGGGCQIWDVARNLQVAGAEAELWRIESLAFSECGSVLLANWARGLSIWHADDGALLEEISLPLRFRRRVIATRKSLVMTQVTDGKYSVFRSPERVEWTVPSVGKQVPFISGNGQWLAAAGQGDSIHVWSLGDQESVARRTDSGLACVFSPSGRECVSFRGPKPRFSSRDDDVPATGMEVWQAADGRCVKQLSGQTGHVRHLRFMRDGRFLVAESDQEFASWNLAEGTMVARVPRCSPDAEPHDFDIHDEHVWMLAVDSDVRLWRSGKPGRPWKTLRGAHAQLKRLLFAPRGPLVAAAAIDGMCFVWDVGSEALVGSVRAGPDGAPAIAFSPDGKLLATGGSDRKVRLWDASTASEIASFEGHEELTVQYHLRTRDGASLASAPEYADMPVTQRRSGVVNAVAFSPSGRFLASGSDDETVRIWDIERRVEGRCLQVDAGAERDADTDGAVRFLAFLDEGRVAAVTRDRRGIVWNIGSGAVETARQIMKGVRFHGFSPDGRHFAGTTADKFYLFDSHRNFAALGVPAPFIPDYAEWTLGGQHLIVAADDGAGAIWDRRTEEIVESFRSSQGRIATARIAQETFFASLASDHSLVRMEIRTGTRHQFESRIDSLKAFAVMSDAGRFATLSTGGMLRLHEGDTGKVVWSFRVKDIDSLRFLDSFRLATFDRKGGLSGVWELHPFLHREPTEPEIAMIDRERRTFSPGTAKPLASDLSWIGPGCDGWSGEFVRPERECKGWEFHRTAKGWKLSIDGQDVAAIPPATKSIAVQPNGDRLVLQFDDDWQLYAVENALQPTPDLNQH